MRNPGFLAGLVLAGLVAGMTLTSLVYTPYGYNDMDPARRFTPPGAGHLMGTDNFGRDIFSRVMAGGRATLLVALVTVLCSAAAGSALGLLTGYAGGLWAEVVMRVIDAINSFPGLLLALVMVSIMGNGPVTLIIALVIIFIPSYVRIMRSGMIQYKDRDFIKAAELMGASHRRIIFVHILPNTAPSLLASTALGLSNAILAEATMSYLGLGIPPPIPSWGRMLAESRNFLFAAPWCALAPGFMIMLAVISFHSIGEGISKRYS
ncbi:MAG: ABC transporter permease [Treponema sp.]|nr:ABC transporter permease [Treponema sp.]